MNWIKGSYCMAKFCKSTRQISKYGLSWNSMVIKHQSSIIDAEGLPFSRQLQSQADCVPAAPFHKAGLGPTNINSQESSNFKLTCFEGKFIGSKHSEMTICRQYSQSVQTDFHLNRDFLAQLWLVDRKLEASARKSRRKIVNYENSGDSVLDYQPSLGASSSEEFQVAPLLDRSNLLITRDIEWANLMLGFEQENRYAVVDVSYPQAPVGFIREKSNLIFRQLLRGRRPFVAHITSALGNELFMVRRPFWWINSSIYAVINGKEVGVVHRRWHLWRRVYDLYLGNKQFAVVENPGFWNWTFTLKDIDGNVLAEIDRDWRGFGFELFTDAGQYVIRFGSSTDPHSNTHTTKGIQELEVARPLTLSERAVAVALAVSLDNDYFSRHGGWGVPFFAVEE